MTRFVVDASVAVKWFVPEDDDESALSLLDPANELHAPDLITSEFGNTVWKKLRREELNLDEALTVVRALRLVPLRIHPSDDLLIAAFEIAFQTARTVYDSLYLSLAVALGSELITADGKLVKALSSTPLAARVKHVRDVRAS